MKSLRIAMCAYCAVSVTASRRNALFSIARMWRRRECLRVVRLQAIRHLSSHSPHTVTSLQQNLSPSEGVCVHFGTRNKIIQPTIPSEMISKFFNVSKTTSYRILHKDERLKNCDVYTLSRNMNILLESNVDPVEVRRYLMLLYRCPLTTEHNIAILKELGIANLNAQKVIQFTKLFKSRVFTMKSCGLLPGDFDPLEVLSTLQVSDQIISDVEFPIHTDEMTLGQLHQVLSSAFLCWSLNATREEIGRLCKRYRIVKKSITLQHRVLTQLRRDWNIQPAKVLLNGYLLMCSPMNLTDINNNIKELCGVSVKECVSLTPRLLTIPYHQLLQVDRILSKLQTPDGSFKAPPRLCTLHPDTIQQRINHLQQSPEFGVLKSHPRVPYLIFYHKKVTSRLNQLQQVKNTDVMPSLNTLSGTKMKFDKYLKVGELRKNKREIIMVMSKYLNANPTDIRKQLVHVKNWGSHITTVNVQKNLLTLTNSGFTDKQIMFGLDVVIYPPDLLQEHLSLLPNRPHIQPFSYYKTRHNILHHLLYFMEKNASLH